MNNNVLSTLAYFIKQEKKTILLLLGISMISSGIVVAQPYLMQKLIDDAFLLKNIELFFYLVTIIVAIGIFGIILSVFLQYNYTKLSIKILFNLRVNIFEKVFLNNKLFFQKYKSGDLLSRLQGDISELQRFGIDSIFALFSATFGLIGAIIIMGYYDITLCLFAIILLPIEFFLLKPIYPKMESSTRGVRESTAFIGSFVIESLRYVNFIKKLNQIENKKDELSYLQNINTQKLLHQQKIQIIFTQIPVIIALLARTALIVFGGYKVIQGELSIGELMAFLTYFTLVLNPVHTLLGILNNLPKLKVSIQRLDEIIPNEKERTVYKNISTKPNIKFENISFSYPNKTEIFKDINLDIIYGEKVVIAGKNGIGKSTLFDILINFLSPSNGAVYLDNIPIKDLDNTLLQNTIGLVEQNPVIFATTLKENLLVAKKEANEDELLEVLKKVGLKLHLDTNMSESGENLSGGQKQRIAIARMILKNPPILLLDEPTSAQDKEFVANIDKLIDDNFKDNTKIIISHNSEFKNAKYLTIEDKTLKEISHG